MINRPQNKGKFMPIAKTKLLEKGFAGINFCRYISIFCIGESSMPDLLRQAIKQVLETGKKGNAFIFYF